MGRTLIFVLSELALVVGPLGLAGCSHTPNIYTMPPENVEKVRSDLGTVGVAISSYRVEAKTPLPAKGPLGGAARGFLVGASFPIIVGALIPLPGTSFIGVLVAPFTAVGGMFYGAVKAAPAEEIEKAQAALEQATAKLRAMNLRQTFLEELVDLGSNRAGLKFVALSDIGPQNRKDVIQYDQLDIAGIDTVLEVRVERAGLRGPYELNPPSAAYLELRSQLIRVNNKKILFDETIYCVGEAQRTLVEWAENEGQIFINEFVLCVPELVEKIIDDFFLVYPIATR